MKKISKNRAAKQYTPAKTEWITLGLIGLTYVGFGGVTIGYHQLPVWLLMPLAGYILGLYSSLQHEILHGHPTPWQWLNEALLFPALTLWLPFQLYKQTHLQHHNNDALTDPTFDPESFYLSPDRWQALHPWQQRFFLLLNAFAGRVLLGPLFLVPQLFYQELKAIWQGNYQKVAMWAVHGVAVAIVMLWVIGVCGISFWAYLLYFVYPGIVLALVRSYLEHRAVMEPAHRSVIVDAGPFFSLLFLNNNLHAIHHDQPGLAWYRLPAIWQERRAAILSGNDHYYFSGYGEVAKQFAFRVKEPPCHPLVK